LIEFLRDDPAIKNFYSLRWLVRWHGEQTPGLNLVHTHFDGDLLVFIMEYISNWPTVVSLRDPLLSILSAFNRDPKGDYTYLVDQFVRQAKLIDSGLTRYAPIYFPIDLIERVSFEERVQQFTEIFAPLGYLDKNRYLTWADRWPYINSQRHNPYRILYRHSLGEEIKQLIPNEWNALVSARPILQPFLEAQGYTDLLWW